MSKGGTSKEESFQTGAPSSCLNPGDMVSTESVECSMPGWNLVATHIELLAQQTWQPSGPWGHYAYPSSATKAPVSAADFCSVREDITARRADGTPNLNLLLPSRLRPELVSSKLPLGPFTEETRVKLGGAGDMPGFRVVKVDALRPCF